MFFIITGKIFPYKTVKGLLMFDLGIQELILIFVVALLVFGPKKLPELSRALGKGVRELKIALRGVKDSFDEAESQIEESIHETTQAETVDEGKDKESAEAGTVDEGKDKESAEAGTVDEGKDKESAEAGTEQDISGNYGEEAGDKTDNG